MRILVATSIIIILSFKSYSQIDNRNFEDLIESHLFTSNITGNSYNIQVSLPKRYYDNDSISYPVLYALDGMHSVPMINSIRQYLKLGDDINEFIIVGIQGNVPRNRLMQHRIPDYTPQRDTLYENRFNEILGLEKGSIVSGKADEFLNFLSEQIIPTIEKKYRVNKISGLLGHSLAGLFTSYTLVNEPELFSFYFISSPAFKWNNCNFVNQLKLKEPINSEISVFLTVGGEEEEIHDLIKEFEKKLQDSSIETMFKVYENETHFSVVAGAFSHAVIQFAGKKEIPK